MADSDPLAGRLRRGTPDVDADDALRSVRARHRHLVMRRRGLAAAACGVVVIALVAGALASRARDDEPNTGPVEQQEVETAPTITLPPTTTAVPSDRLPVQVTPRRDLRDGQVVTVTAQGFTPRRLLQVSTCLPEALTGGGTGLCDQSSTTAVHVRPDGTIEVTHPVLRVFNGGRRLEPIDCAEVDGGCVVAVGDPYDLRQSGGVPVTFDPSLPAPEPPVVTISPAEDLRDGEEVEVTVTGAGPRAYVSINVCAVTTDGTSIGTCEPLDPEDRRDALADADGSVRFPLVVRRLLVPFVDGEPVDCGVVDCVLSFLAGPLRTLVPLAFDPDEPPPPEPAAEVDLPSPLRNGDVAEIRVEHFRPGEAIVVYACPSGEGGNGVPCFGGELEDLVAAEDGSAGFLVRIPDRIVWRDDTRHRVDCARRPGRCDLVVTNFYREVLRLPLTFD